MKYYTVVMEDLRVYNVRQLIRRVNSFQKVHNNEMRVRAALAGIKVK